MSFARLSSVVLSISLAVITCINAQARTNIDVQIITPVPPIKETLLVPQGYSNCDMVAAGWSEDGIWIPKHEECQYQSAAGVSIWATGYWGCTKYLHHGQCRHWKWVPGHWSRHARNWQNLNYHHRNHENHHQH